MSDPDLPVLVARAQKGDAAAFEQVVRGSARLVYAHVVALARDRQKAEDLTQEIFLGVWKSLGTLRNPAGFTAWLLTLARNMTLDALKFEGRKKRRAEAVSAGGEAADDAADPGALPAEEMERVESRERALQLLEELPEDYRRPLMMRYLAGADYEAIRRELGLSDGALRGLLNRGMALLRERMTRLEK